MYIPGCEAELRAFLAQNTAFWYANTGYAVNKHDHLYVDLAHDNPGYLLSNLWIAKYIQKLQGGRLIGLAQGWMKPCPYYQFDRIRELADSFLVDDVINLDSSADETGDVTQRFAATVNELTGEELRKAVLGFDADTDQDIGWILYDTWLRQEYAGTLDRCEPTLIECAQSVFRARLAISRSMRDRRTIGAVVGHYHYSPYSFMALEAAKQGAPVYFQWPLVPVSIRRFATGADVRRGRAADFVTAYEECFSAHVEGELLERWKRRMFDIQRGTREFLRVIAGNGSVQSRASFLMEHRLDPKRPVVCLYVPALCAAPHCFGSLAYDDFADWLRRSLEIAVTTPGVNFFVKRHPQDSVYDRRSFINHLESIYGSAGNIRFLGTDISAEQMREICDLVAVVNGTPGYDMAARGVPTVTAALGRYSGLGFSKEAIDVHTYQELLAHAGDQKLSDEEQRRALLFAYFELAAARSQSLFVPRIRIAGTAEFWNEAELNLRSRYIEEDPLFRNLRYMLDHNLPFLLNQDLLNAGVTSKRDQWSSSAVALGGFHAVALTAIQALEDRAMLADRKRAEATDELFQALAFAAALMKQGQPVRFGNGQPGQYLLSAGWSHAEPNGVWTDGHQADIVLPWVTGKTILCMECTAFVSETSPVRLVEFYCNGVRLDERKFSRDGSPEIWRVDISATGPRIRVSLRIPSPATAPGDPRLLGVWLSGLWTLPSATILDTRSFDAPL
jgi:hypothetical protein